VSDFRYQMQRRADPMALLEAAARQVEAEGGWRVDSRTDRHLLVSRPPRGGLMRSLARVFTGTSYTHVYGRRDRTSEDIVADPERVTTVFLSIETRPTSDRDSELELRGSGGPARRLALLLLRRLETLSDADLRHPPR